MAIQDHQRLLEAVESAGAKDALKGRLCTLAKHGLLQGMLRVFGLPGLWAWACLAFLVCGSSFVADADDAPLLRDAKHPTSAGVQMADPGPSLGILR